MVSTSKAVEVSAVNVNQVCFELSQWNVDPCHSIIGSFCFIHRSMWHNKLL